jgi:hypothetical protein
MNERHESSEHINVTKELFKWNAKRHLLSGCSRLMRRCITRVACVGERAKVKTLTIEKNPKNNNNKAMEKPTQRLQQFDAALHHTCGVRRRASSLETAHATPQLR